MYVIHMNYLFSSSKTSPYFSTTWSMSTLFPTQQGFLYDLWMCVAAIEQHTLEDWPALNIGPDMWIKHVSNKEPEFWQVTCFVADVLNQEGDL